jgi:hypothetical protein
LKLILIYVRRHLGPLENLVSPGFESTIVGITEATAAVLALGRRTVVDLPNLADRYQLPLMRSMALLPSATPA